MGEELGGFVSAQSARKQLTKYLLTAVFVHSFYTGALQGAKLFTAVPL